MVGRLLMRRGNRGKCQDGQGFWLENLLVSRYSGAMQTIPISLPDNLAHLFSRVCMDDEAMQRRVLSELVVRYLEDIEDAADAARVLEQNNPATPIHMVRQELGLDH